MAAVEKDMTTLEKLIATDADFAEFLSTPLVPRRAKREAMEAIADKSKMSAQSKHFLALLADNGRLNAASEIASTFGELMTAHRGEVMATVTSAETLTAQQMGSLNAALSKFLLPGQILKLDTTIDPEILGGLKVELGERQIDLSVRTRIQKLQQLLEESI